MLQTSSHPQCHANFELHNGMILMNSRSLTLAMAMAALDAGDCGTAELNKGCIPLLMDGSLT
jgi:hypothetical protein